MYFFVGFLLFLEVKETQSYSLHAKSYRYKACFFVVKHLYKRRFHGQYFYFSFLDKILVSIGKNMYG